MKYVSDRPLADPEIAATLSSQCRTGASISRRSTSRSCTNSKGRQRNTRRALSAPIANGWLALHESGTYVKFTEAGAALFA